MLKPQMPNIPGVGAVADTLDFVKNLWGSMSVPGMSIPGMTAPTLSVDELDKKIADLKAVEAWLNVNVSMLRGTIQALEVQRGTIATLKSMGATLAAAVKQPGANEKTVLAAAPYASAFFQAPAAEPKVEARIEVAPAPAPTEEAKDAAPAAAAMANPVAWWNMLQDQFKTAVTTAMASDAVANATSKLAAANPAMKLGKAMVSAAVKPAVKKPAAKKAAAKRAPAKPKAPKA